MIREHDSRKYHMGEKSVFSRSIPFVMANKRGECHKSRMFAVESRRHAPSCVTRRDALIVSEARLMLNASGIGSDGRSGLSVT